MKSLHFARCLVGPSVVNPVDPELLQAADAVIMMTIKITESVVDFLKLAPGKFSAFSRLGGGGGDAARGFRNPNAADPGS